MTSKLVHESIERAGLGPVLARRERGEVPDDDAVVELLATADILALGAAADFARRRECGPETRIFVPFAPLANAIMTVLGEREAARGTELLRGIAVLRLTGPIGQSIVLDFGVLGLEIAQVGLSFGATDLAGPLGSARGLLVVADDQKRVVKRREIAGFVERAGFTPVFVTSEMPAAATPAAAKTARDHAES
jgi:2-iminoacetate synthase ThiH